MTPPPQIISALAQDLARRLWPAPPPPRPGVAEAAMEAPEPEDQAPRLQALEDLARAVVETVLELSGRHLTQTALTQALEKAAASHLERLGAAAGPVRARLLAGLPRLLDLPELMRLAAAGLTLGPAASLAEPEPELVVGPSPAFRETLRQLEQVAGTDLAVLLWGETGTGKELLARRLHALSPRRNGPFVAVNCAGLSKGLLESELFGHVKGAFTGANGPGEGYLRAAQGGTLFLDEIGETSPEFQVRLLRVLEDQVVVPVGSARGQRVDFRLISASHRDLGAAMEEGRFNSALYYRVRVVPIHLPPLRRRREDLPLLIDHFLAQACLAAKRTRGLSPALRQRLLDHAWPGNLRELKHLIQRLVALAPVYEIGPEALPSEFGDPGDDRARQDLLTRLEGLPGLPAKRAPELAELLAGRPEGELANRDVREALGCSDGTAKNLLKTLAEAGLLEIVGDRGGRRYRVPPPREG